MGVPHAEVIGDPIAHSKSPLIHKFWLEKLGIEADYHSTHVAAEGLSVYLESRRSDPDWRGCNVTIPHKESIIPRLDEVEDGGIGAVNCVLPRDGLLVGRNTDVQGIAAALASGQGIASRVCLIGAGGAARAALHFLRLSATAQVSLIARDSVKAKALQEAFIGSGSVYSFDESSRALEGAEWIINATPLGMVGQPPMPRQVIEALDQTGDHALVFDMVYAPLETPLLARARQLDRRTADGLTMLIGQAAAAFELFFGRPAPLEYDADVREYLTS
jgi:shikimate dehydrogenase